MLYRGFYIYYDPDIPPSSSRLYDWHWVHKDYDGPGDDRLGHASSREEAMIAVDNFIQEIF